MPNKTPPLFAAGTYTLISPWATVPNTVYRCIAVRAFQDLEQHGVNILTSFYTPMGLGSPQYLADKDAGATIVTLVSDSQPTIFVPDTYISAYPNQSNVAYANVVLAAQLGPVPDTLDLAFAKAQMAALLSDIIGIEPIVNILVAPSTQVITVEQAEVMETARQAAINNRTTDHATNLQLRAQLAQANELISTYEALAVANSWVANVPPPAPAADGTAASFTSVATHLAVAFTDTSTPGSTYTITGWAWDFGDGVGTSTTQNPSYTYPASGTYLVTLTVTDSHSQTATVYVSQTVTAVASPSPPPSPPPHAGPSADGTVADFDWSAATLAVTFSDLSVPGVSYTLTAHAWDFGDGGTSTASSPSHTYSASGTYIAQLVVTDSNGQTASISRVVTV